MKVVSLAALAFVAISWLLIRVSHNRLRREAKVWLLILLNLAFLVLDSYRSVGFFLLSVLLNFGIFQRLRRLPRGNGLRAWLYLGIALNTLIIFTPKLARMGGTHLFILGVSYYSIQQIMLLIDLYEERTHEDEVTVGGDGSLRTYLSFTSFFGQLTSGPICSWRQTGQELTDPTPPPESGLLPGILMITRGVFHKIVLSALFSLFAHLLTADPRVPPNVLTTFLLLVCMYLELYFGFSGYTDIATGIAWLFGVRFPLNFNQPLRAVSTSDFWSRWHMTLTNFVRSYVYFPINRRSDGRGVAPKLGVILCLVLVGIWHEPAWRFVVFGVLHGLAILLWPLKGNPKSLGDRALRWVLTHTFVTLTMAFMFSPNLRAALGLLSTLRNFDVNPASFALFDGYDLVQVLFCLGATVWHVRYGKNVLQAYTNAKPRAGLLVWFVSSWLISLLYLNSGLWRNFIYADF